MMKKCFNLFLVLLVLPFLCFSQNILLADFEQSTYEWLPTGGSWTTTGNCFGTGPAQGTLASQQTVTGYMGEGLINTYLDLDASIGTLTSPSFTITRKYIRFLIGAGNWRPETSINLLIEGEVVRTAVGMGDREHLDWLQWNVSDLLNETAQIRIVDSTTGGWGHVNVDHIIATDTSLSSAMVPNKKYLLLPVKTGATKRLVELVQEGLVVREMNVELSKTPDYWAFMELAPYTTGKELVVRLDSKLATSTELNDFFVQSDSITTSTPIYEETLRPIYHYSTKRGYLSDPNDLFYKDGVYHMSYQNNPFGWAWENMTHGHAVSTDLVHWTEHPHTFVETYWGEAWNGSSVVDVNNTAGFGAGAVVTMWTGAAGGSDHARMAAPNRFSQLMAYSTDDGYTYSEYEDNPAVPWINGWNHDPVLFWYEPGNHWVQVLFVEGPQGEYHIFNSTDLKNWVFTSSVTLSGNGQTILEVPDLYPLALDGDPNNVKWVFSAGYRQYIVGTFDGKKFTKEAGPFWFARQQWDLSAALTFNHTPDGRRIMLSNGRTDYPGMPFNRYMNLPNVLTLKTFNGEPRVFINPIAEVSDLRTGTRIWGTQTLNTGVDLMEGLSGEGIEIEIVFKPQAQSLVTFKVGEFWLAYNNGQGGKIGAGGQWRSLQPMADGNVHIRAFYDRGSWEVFANEGEFYMPIVLEPKAGTWPLSLTTSNDNIEIVSLSLHHMGSMWSAGGGTNSSPTASFTYTDTDLTADFDGSGSSDSDGSINSWEWDFGDGNTGSGELVSHTYGTSGDYTVTLTVTDNEGATYFLTQTVSAGDISGGASTMHVASIVEGSVDAGGGKKKASATVTILDNLGNAVGSATVTGTFSGDYNETKFGATDSNGTVTLLTSGSSSDSLNFKFCVDNVTHSSLTYDTTQNLTTCSEASGVILGNLPEREEEAKASYIYPLYPNPVSARYFMIDRNAFEEKELMIMLFDLTGQEVFKKMLSDGENRVDLSDDLPNGVYQVVIKGNDTTRNGRLMMIR